VDWCDITGLEFAPLPATNGSGLAHFCGIYSFAANIFTEASLKVGSVVWRDHQILAMDMKEISGTLGENVDGILGMDFLSEFETVVVDVRHHKLILR
jgi:hypothetical protein